MDRSVRTMNVYEKLMQARITLQSMDLKKSGLNKFAGYSYFELADFLPTIQTIFHNLSLCGFVSYGVEEATITIVDTESEGKIVIASPMSKAALKGCHEVQNLGAVQTYLRRYLWVTALEIVEHDALDSSPPVTKDGKPEVKKVGGLTGIGDDLSQDWKVYLEETAKLVTVLVLEENFDQANTEKYREPLDDVQELYLERFLDSKTRSAMRKFNQTKG